jgi:hypothetical protein
VAPESGGSGGSGEVLRGLVHDLGNLAYRLTFLSANLKTQIPDPTHRGEAVDLLIDTTDKLNQIIEKLRKAGRDA